MKSCHGWSHGIRFFRGFEAGLLPKVSKVMILNVHISETMLFS